MTEKNQNQAGNQGRIMRHSQKKKRSGKIHIENIDIREVFDDLNIDYAEEGKNVSAGWIGVACPFCSDNANHLGVHLESKKISCFKCGTTGTVIKYLAEELNSFSKALTVLGDAVPRELRSFAAHEKQNAVTVELPKEASSIITPYHAKYLKGRGFNPQELTDQYNLHFCGPLGKWANRIIVPVVKNYRLITFTSIDISDETDMRYRHLADELSVISIKDHLFGLEWTDGHSCCLTEGLFDMFRIGPGAMCSFGVKLTSAQKRLLSKFNKVIICFDGDKAGRVGADKIADDICAFCDVRIIDLPDDTDPDKLPKEEIRCIRNKMGKD